MKHSRRWRVCFMLMAQWAIHAAQAQQPFDLDPAFHTSLESRNVNSIAIMPDGKVLISGRLKFSGVIDQWPLARLMPNGTLDPSWSFGTPGGSKITPWTTGYYVGTNALVRRLNVDGQLDPGFILMTNGPYFSPGQGGDYHVYPDGRVLMTGLHVLGDSIRGFEGFYSLVWFTNTGYLDTTQTHRSSDNAISTILQQPDGKFLLSGSVGTYEGQAVGRIFRVHPDGGLDTTFQTDFDWGYAQTISVLPDERVIASGYMTEPGLNDTLKIVRLLADGSMDPTFNNTLSVTHDAFGSYLELRHHLLPDGRIVLLGQFDHVDGEPRGGLALLDPDGGLLNDAFTGTGCGQVINTNLNTHVQGAVSMTPAPDGSYYISGIWRGYDDGTVNDTTQRYVSRLYGLDVGSSELRPSPQGTLKVIPNPASTHTTFHYTLPAEIGSAHIVVMDAHGKRLDRLRATPPMGQLIWDTRKMPPGVYIVDLLGSSGSLVRERFVVQP